MNVIENNSFSVEYNTRLPGFFNKKPVYMISIGGKINPANRQCPNCKRCEYVVENGYHNIENSLILSLGLNVKIGQLNCTKCNFYWSTNPELINGFVREEKNYIKTQMLLCVRRGLSFKVAAEEIGNSLGHKYSSQYLQELYDDAIKNVTPQRFHEASGIYYYDEQFLLVNRKKVCRLTVIDAVHNEIILDIQTPNAQEETIKATLQKGLQGLPVEAFIVDMRQGYPSIIKELYPKAKIQWCIFHLYKLIWKELEDEFGKSIPLCQLYNAYTIFDIFFDHTRDLEKLKELLKEYQALKTDNPKKNLEIEHTLRKEFGKFVRTVKKERRRNKESIRRRTLQESEKKFQDIKKLSALYPPELKKRIQYIEENWDKFILFQQDSRVQPTSNGIEHYFAATLAKTNKKDFRSEAAVTCELTACQAEWNGQKLFSVVSLNRLITMAGLLFLAFPPT